MLTIEESILLPVWVTCSKFHGFVFCKNNNKKQTNRLSPKHSAHKLFRVLVIHDLVQPLLDIKSEPKTNLATPGHLLRLKSKHFLECWSPKHGCYVKWSYEKICAGKFNDTKHQFCIQNIKSLYARTVLKNFAQNINTKCCILLPIGTSGKTLESISKFPDGIAKSKTDKALVANGEESTNDMIGNVLAIY